MIENALKHVGNTASALNKDAKKIAADEELLQITTKLEQLDKEIVDIEEKMNDANEQFAEFDLKCIEIDKEIKAALIKGNREELKRDLENIKSQLKQIDNNRTEASKAHSKLFESLSLSRDLLAPVLEKSLGKLNELRVQRQTPQHCSPCS